MKRAEAAACPDRISRPYPHTCADSDKRSCTLLYKWKHGFEKQSTAGYLLPLPEEEPLLIWGKPG